MAPGHRPLIYAQVGHADFGREFLEAMQSMYIFALILKVTDRKGFFRV